MRVDDEGLTFLSASEGAAPDLAIRFRDHSLEDVLLGQADTIAAFRDAEVADGAGWTTPLPVAEAGMLAAPEFEPIPGASLVAVIHVTSTMFGDVGLVERWQDGQLIATEAAEPARIDPIESDLRLTCTLAQLIALRRREITPPDAFADGALLQTEWPYMGCFLDLVQHSAYADAYSTAPAVEAQIAWGQMLSKPAFGEALIQAQSGARSPA